jgi:PHP family Zn ribbon phosphoesterase
MNARIDFHIHSCLSPCASLDLSPREIVRLALDAGLDCIALTDHSCAENLPAFQAACREARMNCLYGMEVSTAEEVHVLCIFDELPRALDFGRMTYRHLPDVPNDPNRFGEQPVVNAEEEIEYFAEKLLNIGTDIPFFDLVPMALDAGALCIPSHIDRPVCGAISHLGFLPDLPYDAVEAVGEVDSDIARRWPVVRFSDAHYPEQIGRRFTEVETDAFTVPALRAAFQKLLLK